MADYTSRELVPDPEAFAFGQELRAVAAYQTVTGGKSVNVLFVIMIADDNFELAPPPDTMVIAHLAHP